MVCRVLVVKGYYGVSALNEVRCPYRGDTMSDMKKKPNAKSGKAKKQAMKANRQDKEMKKEADRQPEEM